jgi:anti-sigma28 factor (negative regulator of flagellin synthesis)
LTFTPARLQQLKAAALEANPNEAGARAQRVASLREAVQRGMYQVSADQVAGALWNWMLAPSVGRS